MAIFDRILRNRSTKRSLDDRRQLPPIAAHLLPEINQRVTIAFDGESPVPSRVEDVDGGAIHLAYPSLELEDDDEIVLAWELDDVWFTLQTRVLQLRSGDDVPTILVAPGGQLGRFDEQRTDVRRLLSRPLDVHVLRSRAVRAGRTLHTVTTEIGTDELRFVTTAPFAPGDMVEATISIDDAGAETIGARLRISRVDTVPGAWRTVCTGRYDEILRSDRARLVAIAQTLGDPIESVGGDELHRVAPPTLDGVGGRDQPEDLGDLGHVVAWLRRHD